MPPCLKLLGPSKGVQLECGYRMDIVVERQLVVEIKSVDVLCRYTRPRCWRQTSTEPFYRTRIAIDKVALHDVPGGFRRGPRHAGHCRHQSRQAHRAEVPARPHDAAREGGHARAGARGA